MGVEMLWKSAYFAYMAAMLLMAAWIVATPLIAYQNADSSAPLYDVGKYICHQKISRTLCLFDTPSWGIGDCTPQKNVFRDDKRSEICADGKGGVAADCSALSGYGYKFPVSARDMAIYFGMLFGGVAFAIVKKPESTRMPNWIWLAIALLPIAIDGITQLFFLRESGNALRVATGLLAGVAMSFYILPIFNTVVVGTKLRKALSASGNPIGFTDTRTKAKGDEKPEFATGWVNLAIFAAVAAIVYAGMLILMHPSGA